MEQQVTQPQQPAGDPKATTGTTKTAPTTGTPPAAPTTTATKAGDPPKQDDPKTAPPATDGFKSEESKQAVLADLAKEREARKALEAKFDKLGEAFGVTKPENGKTDLDALTERLAKLEEARTSAERDALRLRVASKHQIDEADAVEFLTGADEAAMTRQAERIVALRGTTPGTPKPDPTQGSQGGAGVDLDARIDEAQKKGDYRAVIALQNQKLANAKK